MNPIDILIRSGFDPKGFSEAQKASGSLLASLKAGIGIDLGRRLTDGFLSAAKAGVEFNAEIEQQTVAFETLLGSAAAAHQRVQALYDFAAATPFEFSEVIQADRILQSLTNGALAGEQGLRLVGDAAAAVGRNFNEAAMWIGRVYAGLKSGTPIGEATMRLIEMGLIGGEQARKLNALAESGNAMNNAFEVVEKTFGRFSGAMEKQSHTLNGQMSTLKDNLRQLAGTGATEFFEALKASIEGINKLMSSPTFQQIGNLPGMVVDPAGTLGRVTETEPGENPDAPQLQQQYEALSESIRKLIKTKRDAGDIDADEAARLAKLLRIYGEAQTAIERLARVRDMAANLGRGKAMPNAASRGLLGGAEKPEESEFEGHDLFLLNLELRKKSIKEQQDIDKDAADRAEDENEKEAQAYYKHLDDMERRATVHREFLQKDLQSEADGFQERRSLIESEKALLDADFHTPEFNKRGARIELMQLEIAALDEQIKKLKEKRDIENDPAARELIDQRLKSVRDESARLSRSLAVEKSGADPYSFADQFTKKWTDMQNQVGTLAQQSANAFEAAWTNALNVTSTGLTNWIMGHATAGEALRSIYVGVVEGIVQQFSRMVVEWIASHVLMAGISSAFHAFEVGAHVSAEAAKTEATASGGAARGVLRVGETLFAIIQITLRTAAHLAGELAMTAVTVVQTTIRAAAALIEAIPHLIVAAFKGAKAVADIPYVGPILAIAAIGGIIAAGMAVMKGFKEGGYTGDGASSQVAGVVHGGEYVFTAPQTAAIGRDNLAALARGRGWAGGGGNVLMAAIQQQQQQQAQRPPEPEVHVVVVNNRQELLDVLESSAGRAKIVNIVNSSKMELGIQT